MPVTDTAKTAILTDDLLLCRTVDSCFRTSEDYEYSYFECLDLLKPTDDQGCEWIVLAWREHGYIVPIGLRDVASQHMRVAYLSVIAAMVVAPFLFIAVLRDLSYWLLALVVVALAAAIFFAMRRHWRTQRLIASHYDRVDYPQPLIDAIRSGERRELRQHVSRELLKGATGLLAGQVAGNLAGQAAGAGAAKIAEVIADKGAGQIAEHILVWYVYREK